MGGFSTASNTTRTFALMLSIVFCATRMQVRADDDEAAVAGDAEPHTQFLEELGLGIPTPNVAMANISQEEYVEKMSLYLRTLGSHRPQNVPQLLSYASDKARVRCESLRFHFDVERMTDVEVQSAEVRLLLPHHQHNTTHMRLYQVLGAGRRRLLAKKTIYLSRTQPKWVDFDASVAFQDWLTIPDSRNLGLRLECDECEIETLQPVRIAANAIVERKSTRRKRTAYADAGRSTDCANINSGVGKDKKPKCCRHDMPVEFEKLNMASVVQPKRYEAGYCKGRCPLSFNYATNHSRIQNLVHKLDKRSTPRACCAPSKLEPLEVLMVDPNDPSKLTVHRWDNMIVVECACS